MTAAGTVLDASAVLAFLGDEPGRDVVGRALAHNNCVMSSLNWSEVWQKGLQHSLPMNALRALAEIIDIVPVSRSHGERAAELWKVAPSYSIADRVCLGLTQELDVAVLTADHAWAEIPDIEVHIIR